MDALDAERQACIRAAPKNQMSADAVDGLLKVIDQDPYSYDNPVVQYLIALNPDTLGRQAKQTADEAHLRNASELIERFCQGSWLEPDLYAKVVEGQGLPPVVEARLKTCHDHVRELERRLLATLRSDPDKLAEMQVIMDARPDLVAPMRSAAEDGRRLKASVLAAIRESPETDLSAWRDHPWYDEMVEAAESAPRSTGNQPWAPPWDGTYEILYIYNSIDPWTDSATRIQCGGNLFTATVAERNGRYWIDADHASSLPEVALLYCKDMDRRVRGQ